MSKILIFGGTTEGRMLAEFCAGQSIAVTICVASEYGSRLIPESRFVTVHTGRITEMEMDRFISGQAPELVLDATHPYAREVTRFVSQSCERLQIGYQRIVRVPGDYSKSSQSEVIWVENQQQAVDYLNGTEGNILAVTGSKEVQQYQSLNGYQQRLFVRVLPSLEAIAKCQEKGVPNHHIIAMQGPFSKALNIALLEQYQIQYLVTKEGGRQGGFKEKLEAAWECGVTVVVIGRPVVETGLTVPQVCEKIVPVHLRKRKIVLVGIGMGHPDQLTIQAREVLKRSQAVFGAARMLESTRWLVADITQVNTYDSGKILGWLDEHPEITFASIIYSGDTGFFSGANGMIEQLALRRNEFDLTVCPGISSLSYFCAKARRSWSDLRIVSLHGRESGIREWFDVSRNTFLLLGSNKRADEVCRELTDCGYGKVEILIGERLSYPEERILSGSAAQLAEELIDPLAVMIIERMDS